MSIARAFAVVLFFCSILMASAAIAASRAERADQDETHSDMLDREAARGTGSERFSADWPDTTTLKKVTGSEDHLASDAEIISGLMAPDLHGSGAAFSPQPPPSHSSVPLPTGFSLFGAGLLTLGLIGFVSGGPRRLAVETGYRADLAIDQDHAATPPSVKYKIEIRSDRGSQLHHTVSARGTIDLIADLLNEGWDIVSIRDRDGLRADYEDILAAWHSERVDDRKRPATLS